MVLSWPRYAKLNSWSKTLSAEGNLLLRLSLERHKMATPTVQFCFPLSELSSSLLHSVAATRPNRLSGRWPWAALWGSRHQVISLMSLITAIKSFAGGLSCSRKLQGMIQSNCPSVAFSKPRRRRCSDGSFRHVLQPNSPLLLTVRHIRLYAVPLRYTYGTLTYDSLSLRIRPVLIPLSDYHSMQPIRA